MLARMMGKKKEDNLRPLSERDIQEKLYGRARVDSEGRKASEVKPGVSDRHEELFGEMTGSVDDSATRGGVKAPAEESDRSVKPGNKSASEAFLETLSRFANLAKPLSEGEIQKKLYGHCYSSEREAPTGFEPKDSKKENDSRFDKTLRDSEAELKDLKANVEESVNVESLFSVPRHEHETKVVAEIARPVLNKVPEKKRDVRSPGAPGFNSALKKGGGRIPSVRFNIDSKWAERLKQFPFAMVFGGVAAAIVIFLMFRVLAQWSTLLTSVIPAREVTMQTPVTLQVKLPSDENPEKGTLKTEKTENIVQESTVAPQAVPKKFYAIQVVVYEDRAMAERLVAELDKKKMAAFSKETTSRRGKKIYEVFVGRFTTADEADKKLAEYRKKNYLKDFQDSFIRPRFE